MSFPWNIFRQKHWYRKTVARAIVIDCRLLFLTVHRTVTGKTAYYRNKNMSKIVLKICDKCKSVCPTSSPGFFLCVCVCFFFHLCQTGPFTYTIVLIHVIKSIQAKGDPSEKQYHVGRNL